MKTDIVCVVWGEQYTQQMLDFCFTSLLAKGNLPDWPYLSETIFHIYTTVQDAEYLKQHPHFQTIANLVNVEWHWDIELSLETYDLMNHCHRMAVAQAIHRQAAVMILSPDIVFTPDCFATIAALLESGITLIMTLAPRVDGACQTVLQSMVRDGVLSLPSSQAVDLFLDYRHSLIESAFWNSNVCNPWNSHFYCYKGTNQVIARGFHLHPLFIVNPHPYRITDTLDGAYVNSYDQQRQTIHIATDNQLLILSLTESQHELMSQSFEGPLSLTQRQLLLDRFRRASALPLHQWFFRHPIVLQGVKERIQDPNSEPHDQALCVLQAFWDLEAAWLADDWEKVATIYADQSHLFKNHLPVVLTQASQCYFEQAGQLN